MPSTRTGKQATTVVTSQGALATSAWSSRWYATCPAIPSTKAAMADRRANRRVRSLITWLLVSHTRNAKAA
jgi:hypothetical protein